MATNPYYKTYEFQKKVIGKDELQLFIKFTINESGDTATVYPEDENVFASDYGVLEWEFDIENFLLMPGFLDLKLSVPKESNFQGHLFRYDLSVFDNTDKRAEVIIKIKYYGSAVWEDEFIGFIVEDSIDYNPHDTRMQFSAAPRTDILNRQMIYKDTTRLNPLGYNLSSLTGTRYFYRVTKIIEDIFKFVNPDCEVEIFHNWLFKGNDSPWGDPEIESGYIIWPPGYDYSIGSEYTGLTFDMMYQDVYWLFNNPGYVSSLGDCIRKLAMDWCCMAGMLHNGKAFFRRLFDYDPNDVPELTDEAHIDWDKQYKLNSISYVKYNTPGETDPYEQGTFTELQGDYIERNSLLTIFPLSATLYSTVLGFHPTEGIVLLSGVKDLLISDLYKNYGEVISKLFYNFRHPIKQLRVDPIIAPGKNYRPDKVFKFNGIIYQPLRMAKHLDPKTDHTEIDGLFLKMA